MKRSILLLSILTAAAGWCFYNGDQKDKPHAKPHRSFDMRQARLFEQLDELEMKLVRQMKAVVSGRLR